MLSQRKRSKIKNTKIQQWRFELGTSEYTIHYKPGLNNYAADLFSQICSSLTSASTNKNIYYNHATLGHPGITRLWHFIRSKNLPYSLSEVKQTLSKLQHVRGDKTSFLSEANRNFNFSNPTLAKNQLRAC